MTKNEFKQRAAIALLSNSGFLLDNHEVDIDDVVDTCQTLADEMERACYFEDEDDDAEELKSIIRTKLGEISDSLDEIRKGTDHIGE